MELAEDRFVVRGTDPAAIVAHVDPQPPTGLGERDLDASLLGVAELDRVRQQIEHDLDHAVEIHAYGRHAVREPGFDSDVLLLEELIHRGERVRDDFLHVDPGLGPVRLARLDLGEIEHLVDQARQPLRFPGDDAEEFPALPGVDFGLVEKNLGEGADRR